MNKNTFFRSIQISLQTFPLYVLIYCLVSCTGTLLVAVLPKSAFPLGGGDDAVAVLGVEVVMVRHVVCVDLSILHAVLALPSLLV